MLALGDIYYPFINNGVGGGIDGMIRWLNASCIIPVMVQSATVLNLSNSAIC